MSTSRNGGPVCSAKACREPATVVLVWQNPRLHSGERVKRWVACPAHQEYLSSFLSARGFLRRVEPVVSGTPDLGSQGD